MLIDRCGDDGFHGRCEAFCAGITLLWQEGGDIVPRFLQDRQQTEDVARL
jgi:hypothetical protein